MKDTSSRFPLVPRLAMNYVILSGAELASKILAAIAFAILARNLGPVNYGHLEFVLALILIFSLVVDSGMSSFGAREIAKDPAASSRLIVHITFNRFMLALGAFVLMLGVTAVIDQPPQVKRLIMIYSLTLFGLPMLIQWVFQGRDLMHYVALASLLRWSIFAAGVIFLVNDSSELWRIPVIEVVAILSVALFLALVVVVRQGLPKSLLSLGYAFSILRKSLPIGASELVWAVKVYFATITLAFAIGGSELGWFTSAHRLVISLHAFVWLYFYNLLPSIARASQGPLEELSRLMWKSTRITALSSIFVAIMATAFASLIMELFYGSQYDAAASVFRILVWLIPLAMISGHYRYTLIGYDKQHLEFLSALGGAIVNVVMNLALIPSVGLVGAAWALVISEASIWWIARFLVGRSVTRIPVSSQLLWPVAAGIILAAGLYVSMPISPWLAASFAVTLYALVLIRLTPELLVTLRSRHLRDQAA